MTAMTATTMLRNGELRRLVAHALERSAGKVVPAEAGGWGFTLCNGAPFSCEARVEGPWLAFACVPDELLLVADAWSGLDLIGVAATRADRQARVRARHLAAPPDRPGIRPRPHRGPATVHDRTSMPRPHRSSHDPLLASGGSAFAVPPVAG